MEKQAICVDKLVYRYQGQDENEQHVVFNGLDLSIAEGSFVAVLGHNGCGKSTLAKHMNAILLPQGGSVTVYGMDTRNEALLLEIRRSVGMVFQNPDNQIVSNVVEEDVAFARASSPCGRAASCSTSRRRCSTRRAGGRCSRR